MPHHMMTIIMALMAFTATATALISDKSVFVIAGVDIEGMSPQHQ